jgi:hypothetical protein
MSRTDVHTPWFVKERCPSWRDHFAEHHDHSTGPCDLDRYLASGRVWVRTRCRLTWLNTDRNFGCGCRMCTGHDSRRAERRSDRHEARREAREALKER